MSSFPPALEGRDPNELHLSNIVKSPKPEKNAYREWISRLTTEELGHYDQMGFKFQLLKAIFEHPEIIALPGEKAGVDKFAFEEVLDMMGELSVHAESFLGKELERDNPRVKALASLYSGLHTVADSATPVETFKSVVDLKFPKALGALVSSKADDEKKKKVEEETKEFLGATDEEFLSLVKALELIKKNYQNIKARAVDTTGAVANQEPFTAANVQEILDELAKVDCLRRVFPGDKRFGLSEIHYLSHFIEAWQELLKELLPKKKDHVEIMTETDTPPSATEEDIREDRRTFLEHRARALTTNFPDMVTPMIHMRHREVIAKKLQPYKRIAETLQGIENKKLRAVAKIFIVRISVILSYLDFMWEMHELENDQGSKRIIYPKKMLLLTPLICGEMEKLERAFNLFVEDRRGQTTDDIKQTLQHNSQFTLNIGPTEDSQTDFQVEDLERAEGVVNATNYVREKTADAVTNVFEAPTDSEHETNERLAGTFDIIAMMLREKIGKARGYLALTKHHTIEALHKYNDPRISLHHETLTYHIQDFITETQGALMDSMVEIVNAFGNTQLAMREIVPEYIEYEEQAADLRYSLEKLRLTSEKAKAELDELALKDADDPKGHGHVIKAKRAFTSVVNGIMNFQSAQDIAMADKKYHGVLKGQHYDLLSNFSQAIKDYFLEQEASALNPSTLATHTLVKAVHTFGEKLERGVHNEPEQERETFVAWLASYKELRKLYEAVQSGHMNGGVEGKKSEKFIKAMMDIIERMKKLAETNERFKNFLAEYHHAFTVTAGDFSPDYFRFERVVTQFKNFGAALGMNGNLVDERLLEAHDERLVRNVGDHLESICSEIRTTGKLFSGSDTFFRSVTECQSATQHLQFRDADLATELHRTLDYLYQYSEIFKRHGTNASEHEIAEILGALAELKQKLSGLFRKSIPDPSPREARDSMFDLRF